MSSTEKPGTTPHESLAAMCALASEAVVAAYGRSTSAALRAQIAALAHQVEAGLQPAPGASPDPMPNTTMTPWAQEHG